MNCISFRELLDMNELLSYSIQVSGTLRPDLRHCLAIEKVKNIICHVVANVRCLHVRYDIAQTRVADFSLVEIPNVDIHTRRFKFIRTCRVHIYNKRSLHRMVYRWEVAGCRTV